MRMVTCIESTGKGDPSGDNEARREVAYSLDDKEDEIADLIVTLRYHATDAGLICCDCQVDESQHDDGEEEGVDDKN